LVIPAISNMSIAPKKAGIPVFHFLRSDIRP
jgi:hypothetical protein